MDGVLYNEKYVAANGFRTFRAASPVRYFKKASDSLYNYKSYKNLEKRIAKDKDGTEIELFVAQLNNNIDYSEPALFYLSEHYGISPGLGKGEMVVFSNYKFNSGSYAGDFVEIKDISTDLYLNKNQIEALIEYVALFQKGDETIDARKALLIEQRHQLQERMKEMQLSLDRLNQKIDKYEKGLMKAEKKLR